MTTSTTTEPLEHLTACLALHLFQWIRTDIPPEDSPYRDLAAEAAIAVSVALEDRGFRCGPPASQIPWSQIPPPADLSELARTAPQPEDIAAGAQPDAPVVLPVQRVGDPEPAGQIEAGQLIRELSTALKWLAIQPLQIPVPAHIASVVERALQVHVDPNIEHVVFLPAERRWVIQGKADEDPGPAMMPAEPLTVLTDVRQPVGGLSGVLANEQVVKTSLAMMADPPAKVIGPADLRPSPPAPIDAYEELLDLGPWNPAEIVRQRTEAAITVLLGPEHNLPMQVMVRNVSWRSTDVPFPVVAGSLIYAPDDDRPPADQDVANFRAVVEPAPTEKRPSAIRIRIDGHTGQAGGQDGLDLVDWVDDALRQFGLL